VDTVELFESEIGVGKIRFKDCQIQFLVPVERRVENADGKMRTSPKYNCQPRVAVFGANAQKLGPDVIAGDENLSSPGVNECGCAIRVNVVTASGTYPEK
jgi:hypothetical protein